MKIGTIRHFHAEKAAVIKPAVSHQEGGKRETTGEGVVNYNTPDMCF